MRAHLGEQPGRIRRLPGGEVVGGHRGHFFFTVGQRKGLGLAGGPWYVVRKELERDEVWICHQEALDGLPPRRLPGAPAALGPARRSPRVPARSRCATARAPRRRPVHREGDGLRVRLAEPDPGLAPGQVAVLYQGERCLGGGQIELPLPESLPIRDFFADRVL